MPGLDSLLFRMPRSSGPRWVVYENGQYVSLARPPRKGTAFLFVDPGHPLQLQTPTGYAVEQRGGLVEAKKFVDRAATILEGRDVNPPTGGNGEPTCPHSATQHMGGECESCYAKRTGWRPGQSDKEARIRTLPDGRVQVRTVEGEVLTSNERGRWDIDKPGRMFEGRGRIERQRKVRLD